MCLLCLMGPGPTRPCSQSSWALYLSPWHDSALTSAFLGLYLRLCSLRLGEPSPENEIPEQPNLTLTKCQPHSSQSVTKISVSTSYKVECSCPFFPLNEGDAVFHWIF